MRKSSVPDSAEKPRESDNQNDTCFFCQTAWGGISQLLCLSDREVDIAQCLMLGDSDRKAADDLGPAPRTVRTHLERLRKKLGVHTRVELVVRIFDAHIDWLCKGEPPLGCRLKYRLARVR